MPDHHDTTIAEAAAMLAAVDDGAGDHPSVARCRAAMSDLGRARFDRLWSQLGAGDDGLGVRAGVLVVAGGYRRQVAAGD